MQNKQNTNNKKILENEHSRTFLCKQIEPAHRLVHLKTQFTTTKSEKNLKHLKQKVKNPILPPVNPYQYWVERYFSFNTNGMKFNTKWYEITKETFQNYGET